jgi:hypothetical protein
MSIVNHGANGRRSAHVTPQDVAYIASLVDTEIGSAMAEFDPATYQAMAAAVVDTVLNRGVAGHETM